MTLTLPTGPGVAIFAGGGSWLPRPSPGAAPGSGAVILAEPARTLVACDADEVRALLAGVEAEQKKGRYVAGYLAYEAGAAFGLTVRTPAPEALPLAWMAVYEPAAARIVPAPEWKRLLEETDVSGVASVLADTKPELSVSRSEYVQAVDRVREYIAAGDTYQVNYTVRARFSLGGSAAAKTGGAVSAAGSAGATSAGPRAGEPRALDPLDYFLALVVRQPVPYAAYLDLGDSQVISLSPEMFLRRDGRRLESRPMKGTRPRGATHAEDVALAYELAETEKERAENLMIVDMVRNDLGRVCRAGTVRVPTLYAVEPYRTVWQMVSTATGEVNPRASLADIMQAVFPGASITGAPKHHTMEIIAALETEPRDVYTGAVGLFSPGGDFACNIAIRTITHSAGHCRLGIGSGIVWDAKADAEYEETLVKAAFATPPLSGPPPRGGAWRPDPKALLRGAATTQEDFYLFETILLQPSEDDERALTSSADAGLATSLSLSNAAVLARYRFLEEHLDRMATSARALGLPFEREAAREMMVGLARVTPGAIVARIQLDAAGAFSLSTREAPEPASSQPVALLVSPFRTDPDDPFLRHKTSLRGFYNREHRRALHEDCFDALFLNRLDHVTEGAITSLFARFGARWVTPPVEDGLLPGIWRACFLSETRADEIPLTLAQLLTADEIVVGNSVRGTVRVAQVVADPLVF
jgi:para-aminobenzoate synthetase/4-amino-4-deoxychorismate lyase